MEGRNEKKKSRKVLRQSRRPGNSKQLNTGWQRQGKDEVSYSWRAGR